MGFAYLCTVTENFNSLSNLLATLTFLHLLKVFKGQLILVYFDVSNAVTTAHHSLVLYNITSFTCSSNYITLTYNYFTIRHFALACASGTVTH